MGGPDRRRRVELLRAVPAPARGDRRTARRARDPRDRLRRPADPGARRRGQRRAPAAGLGRRPPSGGGGQRHRLGGLGHHAAGVDRGARRRRHGGRHPPQGRVRALPGVVLVLPGPGRDDAQALRPSPGVGARGDVPVRRCDVLQDTDRAPPGLDRGAPSRQAARERHQPDRGPAGPARLHPGHRGRAGGRRRHRPDPGQDRPGGRPPRPGTGLPPPPAGAARLVGGAHRRPRRPGHRARPRPVG